MTAPRPKYKPAPILGPHDLAYRPVSTNFVGLVHETQSNAGSAADGFEAAFSHFVDGVGALGFAIGQLDGPLAAAQIEYTAFVIDNGAEVGAAINQGIQALNATQAAIDAASTAAATIDTGASTLPQPNCTPAPPSSPPIGNPSPGAIYLAGGGATGPVSTGLGLAGVGAGTIGVITGTVLPVVGAFLLFNELFNLNNFDQQLAAYQAYFIAWYQKDPLAAQLYVDIQQLKEWQQELVGFPGGNYARQVLLGNIAKLEATIAALKAQILAGTQVPKPPGTH